MNRDYLPVSSGKQWRREIHQGNKSVGSSNGSLKIKCSNLQAVETELLFYILIMEDFPIKKDGI